MHRQTSFRRVSCSYCSNLTSSLLLDDFAGNKKVSVKNRDSIWNPGLAGTSFVLREKQTIGHDDALFFWQDKTEPEIYGKEAADGQRH